MIERASAVKTVLQGLTPVMTDCGFPDCSRLDRENGDVYDVICGNFIIAGLTEDDFGDLTDEQVEKYTQMFYKKELFIRKGQRLVSFTV